MHDTFFIAVILHKNNIPNFNETIAIFIFRSRRSTRYMISVVIENFGTWTTWACITHHPKIIRCIFGAFIITNADNFFRLNADYFGPDVISFIIFTVDCNQKSFFGYFVNFSEEFPCILNGIFFKIITKTKVSEHFKKSVMSCCIPYVF